MSNPKNQVCFTPDHLHRYLSEQLNEIEEGEIRDHLNQCSVCQREMERIAGDETLWTHLREHLDAPQADANDTERLRDLIELLAPTDDPNMLGRIGSYEVVGLIGQGSTGIVVKALEPRLNRFVAIKVLSPVYSNNGAARRRFEREARAVAAVTHENVVPIFAVDEFRGLPYLVMQYIPGISLLQRIQKEGPLDTCEVTRIGLQIAKGLAAAHAQGIVHRDVKPANVLLEETVERAMVTDFGLARVADDASMTRSGTIAGTPSYMSPEQASGQSVDHRSDLFSLGSLMYAACTARPPFRAETLFGVINRVCQSEPRPIREINPTIDPWLVDFIDRLLNKQPAERFQSANEVADELAAELAFLQNPTVAARPTRRWANRPPKKPATKLQTKSAWLAAAALAILISVLGVLILSNNNQNWLAPFANPFAKKTNPKQEWVEVTPDHSIDQDDTNPEPQQRVFWKNNSSDWNTDARQTFDQKVERSFDVQPGGMLKMELGQGDIVVQPSELDHRVHVTVLRRVQATSREEAEVVINKHDVNMSMMENTLQISGAFQPETPESSQEKFENVLYRISVPKKFNHDLATRDGSITTGELTGDVAVKSEHGCIELGRIDGDVNANATGGDIRMHDGATGSVFLMLVRGNAYVCNVDDRTRIRNSGGSVWIGGCKGNLHAQTSGGNVKITRIDGPTRVHTAGGNIVVNLVDSPAADAKFTATSGDVTVRVRDDVKVNLVGGQPQSEDPDQQSSSDHSGPTNQELNGGGSNLTASSANGNVEFKVLTAAQSKGLGGSGLGGSGSGKHKKTPTAAAIAKTSGPPRPGAISNIKIDDPAINLDGYSLYLPVSHGKTDQSFPILVYLQGAWGVGGDVNNVNLWGLTRLIRDEDDPTTPRNKLLLDSFIVVSPHIRGGQYHDSASRIKKIIDNVADKYNGDLNRVYATGLSRGGHGSWGLASKLPGTFAAVAPLGGDPDDMDNFEVFKQTALWIGHNQGDSSVGFELAANAAKRVERKCKEQFLRVEETSLAGTEFMKNRLIFNAPKQAGHDIWTNTYSSIEFYQWLLAQKLAGEDIGEAR